MNDIIKKHILPILDIHSIKVFRLVCRQIDSILDFNYWIDKFHCDNMLIFTTKLPTTVSGWIKEYLIVKDVYEEAKSLWQCHNYINIYNDHDKKFMLNYPDKGRITRLLPNNRVDSGTGLYSIVLARDIYNAYGWSITEPDEIDNYTLDTKLFLLRLLYYFPDVNLIDQYHNSIRSKNIDYYRIYIRS